MNLHVNSPYCTRIQAVLAIIVDLYNRPMYISTVPFVKATVQYILYLSSDGKS